MSSCAYSSTSGSKSATAIYETLATYAESSASDAGSVGKAHIIVGGTTPLHEAFPDDPLYTSALTELNEAGLYTIFHIGAKPQPQRAAGFGMVLGMVASVVATPFIGPSAWAFSSSFMSAAVGAAGVGAASRLASSLYAHGGRIDRAVRDTTSAQSLRGLALDAVSAGLCAGIETKLKVAGLKAADSKTALKGAAMHIRTLQQHAIRAGVHSAVTRENLGKSLELEAGNAVLASAQNVVGDILTDGNRSFKAGVHGLVGATYAAAIGASPIAGMTGGLVAEGLAAISSTNPNARYRASDFAAPTSSATALLLGSSEKDVSLASHVAVSAITYNEEVHRVDPLEEERKEKAEQTAASMSEDDISRAEAIKSSVGYILFGDLGLDDAEKSLIARHDALFTREIRARHVKVTENMLGPVQKTFVNLFLPENKQLVVSAEEIAGTAANSAKPMANTKIPAQSSVQMLPASANIRPTGTLPIIRGADRKIKGVGFTQVHHIFHQKLYDNELWERAGMHIDDPLNLIQLPTTKGSGMTTTKRSVHQGRHLESVKRALEQKMDYTLEFGKQNNYTQAQYRTKLQELLRAEYKDLKTGKSILNAAEDLRKTGGNQ